MSSLESLQTFRFWLHLHSRQSGWYIQTWKELLTPPPPSWGQRRLVSDWWASLSFVFDTQRCLAGRAIHLPCHWQTRRVKLWEEKSGPPYEPPSEPGTRFVSETLFVRTSQVCQEYQIKKSDWQVCLNPAVVMFEAGAALWIQYSRCLWSVS